jgi:hypothetical protein
LASLALALAEGDAASGSAAFVALVDGKRGELFAACYRRRSGRQSHEPTGDAIATPLELALGPVVVPATELKAFLAPWPSAIVGGDGAHLYAGELPDDAHLAASVRVPTAVMALRAWQAGVPGVVEGADEVLPIYGRAPDAVRWTARTQSRRPAAKGEAP